VRSAIVVALALVALGACRKAPPPASPQASDRSTGGARPLDEQPPVTLVFCVDPAVASAGDAVDVIRARLDDRDGVVITTQGDQVVVELPSHDGAGTVDQDQAAAELSAALQGGDLGPRLGPCEPEDDARRDPAENGP
jgi:hypothetical protein